MGRRPRDKSKSGIYHIVLRGNNRQQIFFDEEDYERFLDTIKICKEISRFSLYAYCLMGNHVHILLKEKEEPIGMIMKRLTTRYVIWYNRKYQREGHLFQGRYKSECVEDEEYFFSVIRYIHRNPVKAEVCNTPAEYEYSSFCEYFSDESEEDKQKHGAVRKLCAVKAVFKIADKEYLYRFNMMNENGEITDEKAFILSEEEAVNLIKKATGCENLTDVQKLAAEKQKEYITELREKGLSIRQICRLTGISISLASEF